jgi:dUTP pyrophosphatase
MQINILKASPWAVLPSYATDGSGCFDLSGKPVEYNRATSSLLCDTGLKFEIPAGYVMLVFSRSGHGFNKAIRLANCVGVIDSDYRGNVMIKLQSDSVSGSYALDNMIKASERHPDILERIAQAMIIPVPTVSFLEVDALSETDRGEGGFGSTGVTL